MFTFKSHKTSIRLSRFLLLAVAVCSQVNALDFAQWRGPNRDGISQEKDLLAQWPADGPKLVWQNNDIGFGYGSVAVVGDRFYAVTSADNDEFVKAFAVKDGAELWKTRIGSVGNPDQRRAIPARTTPTVVGDAIYAIGSDGDIACLDKASGDIRWQKSMRQRFRRQAGRLGLFRIAARRW